MHTIFIISDLLPVTTGTYLKYTCFTVFQTSLGSVATTPAPIQTTQTTSQLPIVVTSPTPQTTPQMIIPTMGPPSSQVTTPMTPVTGQPVTATTQPDVIPLPFGARVLIPFGSTISLPPGSQIQQFLAPGQQPTQFVAPGQQETQFLAPGQPQTQFSSPLLRPMPARPGHQHEHEASISTAARSATENAPQLAVDPTPDTAT